MPGVLPRWGLPVVTSLPPPWCAATWEGVGLCYSRDPAPVWISHCLRHCVPSKSLSALCAFLPAHLLTHWHDFSVTSGCYRKTRGHHRLSYLVSCLEVDVEVGTQKMQINVKNDKSMSKSILTHNFVSPMNVAHQGKFYLVFGSCFLTNH